MRVRSLPRVSSVASRLPRFDADFGIALLQLWSLRGRKHAPPARDVRFEVLIIDRAGSLENDSREAVFFCACLRRRETERQADAEVNTVLHERVDTARGSQRSRTRLRPTRRHALSSFAHSAEGLPAAEFPARGYANQTL